MSRSRTVVAVLEPFHEVGMRLLRSREDVELLEVADPNPHRAAQALARAEAVTVRTFSLTADLIERAPRLRMVAKHGVGCDNIDVARLTERGVPVAIAAGANDVSVAEHAMMLMLALAKDVLRQDRFTRSGAFHRRLDLSPVELSGKTVLVVGFGRIGRRVADLARAFGMRILAYDPLLSSADILAAGAEAVDVLQAGLAAADFVCLHVPKTDATLRLIAEAELGAMKPTAFLINCARGGVVDEASLARALREKRIAGAGLDVFDREPPSPGDPLLALENVVASPHNAALSREGAARMAEITARNVLDFLDGRLPDRMIVNPQALGARPQGSGQGPLLP